MGALAVRSLQSKFIRGIFFVAAVLAAFVCIGFSPTAPAADSNAEMWAGVAVVDITPPVPYRMSGYFSERLSTGVHDALKAKAIVLSQGDCQAALVFCDIIGISPGLAKQARRLAEEKTGIPAANIAIAATHSHTGPLYFGALRERFHRKAVAEHGNDPCEKTDYPAELVKKLAGVIADAKSAAAPVTLAAGVAEQKGLAFNRRFHMKSGPVRFNPGVLNPDIVRPAGPIDPDVGILLVRSAAGDRPMASLTVFALHLDTTGGTLYSADYPYYLAEALHKEFGEKFVSMFGAGTCGDINHIDVTQRKRNKPNEIGETLAATVKAEVPKLKKVTPSLAVRREIVDAPLQKYSKEEIAQAKAGMEKVASGKVPFLERVKAYKIMALQSRGGETIPIEVQVFRLGNEVAIVTLPGEVFVDLGLEIKRASPFANTIVIELANDAPGYLPTRKAFLEGSYETVNSRIAPGGGELMTAAAIRLLKQQTTKEGAPAPGPSRGRH